jgi:AcrR family transcriptional regulator
MMKPQPKRTYQSSTRQRQADETRTRIADAALLLLREKGYEGMTIDGIAQCAGVAAPTVYAAFKSKAGILTELIDRASFGPQYQELIREAVKQEHPPARLRFAARIARQIHEAQSTTFDLLHGAGMVTPDLAKLEQQRECQRYEAQKNMIAFMRQSGWLKESLEMTEARDILWTFTARELYRMLVHDRGWKPQQYEDWLSETLVSSLLRSNGPDGAQASGKENRGSSSNPR